MERSGGEVIGQFRLVRVAPAQTGTWRYVGSDTSGNGTDGHRPWSLRGGSVTALSGEDSLAVARDAGLVGLVRSPAPEDRYGTPERVRWEGCDCWRLPVTSASGKNRSEFYSVTDSLYRGVEDTVGTFFLKRARRYVIDRYERVQGVALPVVFRQEIAGTGVTMTVTRTQFDVPVAPGLVRPTP